MIPQVIKNSVDIPEDKIISKENIVFELENCPAN